MPAQISSPLPPLLKVRGLRTVFPTPDGEARAVDQLDLEIERGEIVGIVGESGSGKTVTALSILGLLQNAGGSVSGDIVFDGMDLSTLSDQAWARIRGARIGLIFQDPKSRLNPVFSVGAQIAEILQLHRGLDADAAWAQMLALLEEVNLSSAEALAGAYPHQLSMGQAQRVMIAMALALEPDLLIADEPTASLDATIQAEILDLIHAQQREKGMAILLISHNLAVIAQLAERVVVLYAGHILEQAPVEILFQQPHHPYTQGLIVSLPYNQKLNERLHSIPGTIPDARNLPHGCRFAPRCTARERYKLDICEREAPELEIIAAGHQVRCWLYQSSADHTAPLEPGFMQAID